MLNGYQYNLIISILGFTVLARYFTKLKEQNFPTARKNSNIITSIFDL